MIPTIRLDEENFQEIFETARKRIPLLYPEWTNFNENDSGIALLELFSWLKEVQEFHLNQVGLEHESVYLKLLGIERKEICPARTVVTCCSVKEETELPEGFQFHAGEIPFCSVERTRLFSGKLWRVRTGNTGRQGYVSEREWDGSDTGWKLPVFTETPEYGNFLEMEFAGKMTGGQTFGFFFRLPEERSAKRNPVSEEFEPLVGIRAECKDNGSDSWKICELVRDDTHAFLYSGIIKIRIPDEMGESGADRIRFVFSEGEYDVVPVLSEILLNPVELCQMEQIGGRILGEGTGFWGRGQDSQIRDSRWRAPGQFRPQWNWKQKLLSIREYLKPGDVSVIFPDQSRKTDILWLTERVEISALEMESTDCRRKESSV